MDYIGVGLLVLLLLFIWQLYREPIAIPFLKPYIIKALNHDDAEYEVTLDSVNIELVRSLKPINIIANNVIYKKHDGSFTINAPKTSVSFSIKALLRGMIAPSSIVVNKPTMYVFTTYGVEENKKDEINKKKLEYYFDSFDNFIEKFNSADKTYPESYINDIVIKNAEVEFHEVDIGRKWVFSDLNYRFERNFTNIETELNALLKLKDQVTSLGLEAEFRPSTNKLALQFYVSDFIPSTAVDTFVDSKISKSFYQVNLPINGKIETLINFNEVLKHRENIIASLDTAIEKIKFEFEGGSGDIMFNDSENYKYDISAFLLSGSLEGGLDKLKIENADFDLGGQKTRLSFYVSGLKKLILENSMADFKLKLKADIDKLKLDDLYKYWPRYIAEHAWSWCKESISGGEASNASFVFDFAFDNKTNKFSFVNLQGQTNIVDANLDYLDGMPIVRNIYATVYFFPDSLKIDFDKAISDGVVVNGGYVRLYDLDKYDNFADINIIASGSITDSLKLIDNPPLNYAREMGLEPDKIQGFANTDLSLNFELKQNLTPEEVEVNVKADLKDLVLPKMINDKDIQASNLTLKVNNEGLLVEGKTKFEDIPIDLVWNETFASKDYKSKYKLSFKFDDNVKKKMGVDFAALSAPYFEGTAQVDADVTFYDKNKLTIDINANMKDSKIDFSFLGLKKPLGEEATAKTSINLLNEKIDAIPSFSFSKHDFSLNGKIDLDKNKQVKIIDIYNVKGPKTNARAKIEFANTTKQKVKINISGTSYDLSDFFDKDDENKGIDEKEKLRRLRTAALQEDDDSLEKVMDTDVNIAVNSLWTNEDVAIRNFAGNAKLRNGIGVYEMHLIGNFGIKRISTLKLDYIPRGKKEFLLSIDSTNAGNTLKFLRIHDNMRGGILSVEAKRNANKEFVGHAKIRDVNIYKTPVLARLLTVASFSGMVNLLTGDGIVFSHIDAPFEYSHKILTVKEAKGFGNVMGITANGTYNIRFEEYNIRGVIAPAYSLNNLIGKIPVVGGLLSGKDGTVFAANYDITGYKEDPQIKINPLSALSPSSLKDLFSSLFGDNNGPRR